MQSAAPPIPALVAFLLGCSGAQPAASGGAEAGGDAAAAAIVDAAVADGPTSGDADASGPSIDADAAATDAEEDSGDAASENSCFTSSGVTGECISVSVCAAMTAYSSTPGLCPGPSTNECCAMTPNVAANPPTPADYQLMPQSDVTAAMTTWAVSILDDPTGYPMFSTTMMAFGTLTVLARVEWHPPDFQNSVVHRGVTLYEPL